MKIYLSGCVIGSYRAQNIIKAISDAGIAFTYTPAAYGSPQTKNKYFRKALTLFWAALTAPFRLILIAHSSHVFVLPMNTSAISIAEAVIGKLLRKKIIVDYYISQYDTLVNDRKLFSKDSLRGKLALFKDRSLLKIADIVIFLNEAESAYYQKVAGINASSATDRIIPLCIDYKRELFQKEHQESEFFNVCWWGTYIPLHGLENLIKAFSHVRNDKAKLYIFGDSDEKAAPYVSLIETLGLSDRVIVRNDCSFSNGKLAPFLKQNCDLAIGNFGSSDKAKTVLVNKLVDALSLGIPCLTMKTSATAELIADNEGLIIVDPTPEGIACQIEKYAHDRPALQAIGQAGKAKYLDLFSPDSFKIKLLELLEE